MRHHCNQRALEGGYSRAAGPYTQPRMDLSLVGRGLLVAGLVMAGVGLSLMLAPRLPWLGRLPGDFSVQAGQATVFVPLATTIILSIVLTLILNLVLRR